MTRKMLTDEELGDVYRQHVTLVRMRAGEIIPEPELIEDIVQDVFLAFVRFAKRAAIEDVATALFVIATRVAIRSRRKWAESKRISTLDVKMPCLDTRLSDVEERVSFMKLLDGARDDEATLVVAYFVEQMTQAEIAAATGQTQRDISRILERFVKRAQRRYADSFFTKHLARKEV